MIEVPYKITSHADLKRRIAYLESIKDAQEEVLKQNIHAVYKSLQPAELLKSAIHNIREDEELGGDAASMAGSLGIDFLAGKIFGKDNSIGGFLKAIVVKQVFHAVYNKYQDKIHDFIGNIVERTMDFLKPAEKNEMQKPSREE